MNDSEKTLSLGLREATTGQMRVRTSATKNSSDFIGLLEQSDLWWGPKSNHQSNHHRVPVVLVLDNGPIHTSPEVSRGDTDKATTAALACRRWLSVQWLAK